MVPMAVKFQAKGDPVVWPETKDALDAGLLTQVAILEHGMESGAPSVAFMLTLPNGQKVIAQQTAKQMVMLGMMISARYPNLML